MTDARAQKRSSILGNAPVPELPDVGEQRRVDLKYQKSPLIQQKGNDSDGNESDDASHAHRTDEYNGGEDNNTPVQPAAERQPSSGASPETSATPVSTAEDDSLSLSPQSDTPESLASLIVEIPDTGALGFYEKVQAQ